MHDVGGYSGWRWLFSTSKSVIYCSSSSLISIICSTVIEGLVTIVVGASCYFILPGLASQTKWLSEEERRLAIWRSSVDASGAADEETDVSKWQAAKMAFKDWKVLLLVLQQTCIACSQSLYVLTVERIKLVPDRLLSPSQHVLHARDRQIISASFFTHRPPRSRLTFSSALDLAGLRHKHDLAPHRSVSRLKCALQ